MVIAQPVEDKLELFSGGGHRADVAVAAALSHLFADGTIWLLFGRTFTDSIAAHRTSREPCLVIRPRCTVVSDSW